MVKSIVVNRETLYACELCHYVFEQRKTAEKCQDYCERNKV
jgi:rubredoxin